jgi:hypothetical protein
MTKFIIKVSLFLIPILGLNAIYLLKGYLFSSKNEAVLIHNLKSHQEDAINIKFYGTSRIENGISPEDITIGMVEKKKSIPLNIQNCGMNSQMTGWVLKMQEKYYSKCDLMVVEVHPGKNPMQGVEQIKKSVAESIYLNDLCSFVFNHYLLVQHLPNLISDIRGRLPFTYMYTHYNGWNEMRYFNDEKRINPIREKVARWAKDDLEKNKFTGGWDEFATLIRNLQNRSNCKLMFIRMPVDGLLRILNDSLISFYDPMAFLKSQFPGADFLDTNTDPRFSSIHTVEDSHLEGPNARTFSRILGGILAQELEYKH